MIFSSPPLIQGDEDSNQGCQKLILFGEIDLVIEKTLHRCREVLRKSGWAVVSVQVHHCGPHLHDGLHGINMRERKSRAPQCIANEVPWGLSSTMTKVSTLRSGSR